MHSCDSSGSISVKYKKCSSTFVLDASSSLFNKSPMEQQKKPKWIGIWIDWTQAEIHFPITFKIKVNNFWIVLIFPFLVHLLINSYFLVTQFIDSRHRQFLSWNINTIFFSALLYQYTFPFVLLSCSSSYFHAANARQILNFLNTEDFQLSTLIRKLFTFSQFVRRIFVKAFRLTEKDWLLSEWLPILLH